MSERPDLWDLVEKWRKVADDNCSLVLGDFVDELEDWLNEGWLKQDAEPIHAPTLDKAIEAVKSVHALMGVLSYQTDALAALEALRPTPTEAGGQDDR